MPVIAPIIAAVGRIFFAAANVAKTAAPAASRLGTASATNVAVDLAVFQVPDCGTDLECYSGSALALSAVQGAVGNVVTARILSRSQGSVVRVWREAGPSAAMRDFLIKEAKFIGWNATTAPAYSYVLRGELFSPDVLVPKLGASAVNSVSTEVLRYYLGSNPALTHPALYGGARKLMVVGTNYGLKLVGRALPSGVRLSNEPSPSHPSGAGTPFVLAPIGSCPAWPPAPPPGASHTTLEFGFQPTHKGLPVRSAPPARR